MREVAVRVVAEGGGSECGGGEGGGGGGEGGGGESPTRASRGFGLPAPGVGDRSACPRLGCRPRLCRGLSATARPLAHSHHARCDGSEGRAVQGGHYQRPPCTLLLGPMVASHDGKGPSPRRGSGRACALPPHGSYACNHANTAGHEPSVHKCDKSTCILRRSARFGAGLREFARRFKACCSAATVASRAQGVISTLLVRQGGLQGGQSQRGGSILRQAGRWA